MKRTKSKCKIIPVEVHDGISKIISEDDKHRYVLNDRGHIIKLRRKNCFSCANSAAFVIIFNYAKHNRVERFCKEHASSFGELPEIPSQQGQQVELSSQQKHAIKIMQRWNNIKVNI